MSPTATTDLESVRADWIWIRDPELGDPVWGDLEGISLPFLVRVSWTSGVKYYFAYLLRTKDGSGRDTNRVLQTLLPKLGFRDSDLTQEDEAVAVQPPATYLSQFLARLGQDDAEEWRFFLSAADDSPLYAFDEVVGGGSELAKYLTVSPIIKDEVIIPDTLDTTEEAIEAVMSLTMVNTNARIAFDWLDFHSGIAFYFRKSESGARCNPGLRLPTAASLMVGGAPLEGIDYFDLLISAEGHVSAVEINSVPATLTANELDLGNGTTMVWPNAPGLEPIRISHRLSAGAPIEFSFRGAGKIKFRLQGDSLRVIIEVGIPPTPSSVFIEVDQDDEEFTLETDFPPVTRLFGQSLSSDDLLTYATEALGESNIDAIDRTTVAPFQATVPIVATLSGRIMQLAGATVDAPQWIDDSNLNVVSDSIEANLKGLVAHRLTSFEASLQGLLGNSLENVSELVMDTIPDDLNWLASSSFYQIRMPVRIRVTTPNGGVVVVGLVEFSLLDIRMGNRIDFYLLFDGDSDSETRFVDFGFMALEWPVIADSYIADKDHYPKPGRRHGFINFDELSFNLAFENADDPNTPMANLVAWIPGSNIASGDEGGQPQGDIDDWKSQRFRFDFEDFDPSAPCSDDPGRAPLSMRVDGRGLNFKGSLRSDHKVTLSDDPGLIRKIETEPLSGRLCVANSKVVNGELTGRMLIPGFTNLFGTLTLRVGRGEGLAPELEANLKLGATDSRPSGSLEIGVFDAGISNPRFDVAWKSRSNKWTVSAIADAFLRARGEIPLENGLPELGSDSTLVVRELDLVRLTYVRSDVNIQLKLASNGVDLTIFDGLVGMRLNDMAIGWDTGRGQIDLFTSECEVRFGRFGQLSSALSVGGLQLRCDSSRGVRVHAFSGIGFSIEVPNAFAMSGRVSWMSDPANSYFAIRGKFKPAGLPEIQGFLLYGRGRKDDGKSVPSLVLYGGQSLDKQLGTAIALKEANAGAAYNRRLGRLPENPSVDDIVDNIDTLEPGIAENWEFVRKNGFYLSVVAKVILSSNVGGDASPNAYVASLVFSIDSNLRIIAGGKLWLFSSVRFTKANINRPTLIAAAKLDTRRPAFSAKAVTRRGGAIEFQPQLQRILDQTDAELVYTLTPELSDLNLKRLTYRQNFLGADFALSGRWRFAVFRETILYYVRVTAIGNFGAELSEGPGGFRFNADLSAYLGYGGIFGRLGLMAYGEVGLDFKARCTAFIDVEFKTKTIKCKWKGLSSKCWEDWLVWGERFEKEFFAINLHIYGGIAFEAKPNSRSIDSGVRANISFDRNICGHPLNIAPPFELRRDVITRVKARVRTFEGDLDRAAARIGDPQAASLARSLTKNLAASIPERSSERWFVFEKNYRTGKRWVLIPSIETPWLTPYYEDVGGSENPSSYAELAEYRFENYVSEITVESGAGPSISIKPAWCHHGGTLSDGSYHDHWGTPSRQNRLVEVSDVPEIDVPTKRDAYERLYRLNMMMLETAELYSAASLCPAIRQIKSLVLVDDPRVRTTSDEYLRYEDRINARPGIYPYTFRPRTAPDFEDLEAAISRDQAGGLLGVTRQNEQLRARTTLVGQMLDELDQENGYFTLQSDELQETGPDFDAYIRDEDIEFSPDIGPVPRVRIVRAGVPSDATLVVVTEQTRDLVVDAIKPLPIRQDFVESENEGIGTGKVIVKLPIDWRGLFDLDEDARIQDATKFELLSHFRIYRRLRAGEDFELIADRVPAPIVTSRDRGKVLARPYLSTDVLETRLGRLADTDIPVGQLEVEYVVVPVLIGDDDKRDVIESRSGTLREKSFAPTDVFVPTGSEVPSGLSMLVPATNLLIEDITTTAKTVSNLEFRLFLLSKASDSSDSIAPTAPLLSDFHLFFDTVGVPQSGYYGDSVNIQASEDQDELDAIDPSQEEGRAVRAEQQGSRERFFSPTGRKRLQYSPVFDSDGRVVPNRYQFTTDQLDPQSVLTGRGYRFFIRNASAGDSGLLAELPIFLAGGSLDDDPRESRGEQQLEWFQESELTGGAVLEHEFQTARQIAAPNDPRHRAVVAWQSQAEGGVEIEVIDTDTEELLLQQRTETLAESIFRVHQRDFSEPTRWQLVGSGTGAAIPIGTPTGTPLEQYYWDEHRWFCESPMDRRAGDSSYDAFIKLKEVLRLFATGASSASYCELANAVQVWSKETARFRGDVQNDDRTELTLASDRMEAGVRLMYAGLFVPGTGQNDDRFVDLQQEYAIHREAVLRADLLDTRFKTPTERETNTRDVSTARRILRVIDARLAQVDSAWDVALNVPDTITLTDQIRVRNYLNQTGLDPLAITLDLVAQSCDSLPYATELVDTFKEFAFSEEDPRDDEKYPLTSTFYKWMVDLDIPSDRSPRAGDFDDWFQGRRGAQQLLGAVGVLQGGELSDPVGGVVTLTAVDSFSIASASSISIGTAVVESNNGTFPVTTVIGRDVKFSNPNGTAETLAGQSVLETDSDGKGELDRFRQEAILPSQGVDAYVGKAPYTIALQSIIGQEIEPAQIPKILLRSHDSIRFERARSKETSTEREPIEQSLLTYVPEGLESSVAVGETTHASIQFPIEYFNFLERLGFAVDLVALDPSTGRLSQSQIVDQIESVLHELAERGSSYLTIRDQEYFVFICRGRATDDGSLSGSLVGLSFVKVVTIPRRFIEDLDSVDHAQWLEAWVKSREVAYDESKQKEIFGRFAAWIKETTAQIRRLVETGQRQFDDVSTRLAKDIWFELTPTKFLTVPNVDGQCRAALTLPSLRGQSVQIRLKRVSRYALLADWLGVTAGAESGQLSRAMDYPPYYASNMEPRLPIPVVGYPLDDRIYFSLAYPADVRDSAINNLARTRTGCRGVELFPFNRLIDGEDGSNKTLEEILKGMFPVAVLESSEVMEPKLLDNIQRSLDIPVFANELFKHTVYQHYYNEYALVAESLYDAVFENPDAVQPIDSDSLTYFRRQPSLITARKVDDTQLALNNLESAIKNPNLSVFEGIEGGAPQYWSIEPSNSAKTGVPGLRSKPGQTVRLSQRLTREEDGFEFLKPGKSYRVGVKFEPPRLSETVRLRLTPGVVDYEFVVDSKTYEFQFCFEAPDPGFDITLEILWTPTVVGDDSRSRVLVPREIRLEEVGHMRLHLLQHKDLLDPMDQSEAEAFEPDLNIFPATPIQYPSGEELQFEAKEIPDMAVAYSVLYRDPEASADSGNNWFLHLADIYLPWHPAHQTPGETSGSLSEPLVVRRDAQLDLSVYRVDQSRTDYIQVNTQENASILFQRYVDPCCPEDLSTRYVIDMELRWRNGRPWDNANVFYMVERNHRYCGPIKADMVSSHLSVRTFFTS